MATKVSQVRAKQRPTTTRRKSLVFPPWLSAKRRRPSQAFNAPKRSLLDEASSDRGRVVFSAPFRRLHQKTQVLALELDGAVRTRLTHSLEVAHVGTYIFDSVFERIDRSKRAPGAINNWKALPGDIRLAMRIFVEVACLVHDIGNPPFGHFGEKAISEWFERHPVLTGRIAGSDSRLRDDFSAFDGNKQGFRILTTLQRNLDDEYGLNLTYSQLAATVKYPLGQTGNPGKGSIFESERAIQEETWSSLGLAIGERHPLSLLMEAADDIAYCVSDVEDALDKGIVTLAEVARVLHQPAKEQSASRVITLGRTKLTNDLVGAAADVFVGRISSAGPMSGSSLLDDNSGALGELKRLANKRIYSSRPVLSNEITGFAVIQGLLDALSPLLHMNDRDFRALCRCLCAGSSIYEGEYKKITRKLTVEPAVLALISRKQIAAYLAAVEAGGSELFYRAHLVLDFVSGMTDEFALSTYRLMSGQRTHGNG